MPEEALKKSRMLDKLKSIFESFGYGPIETPHLELTEVLIGQTEGEIGKQLYRFKDNGDRDVCLRFDLTVPFARYAVQYKNQLGLPFKRYAIGNVFRGESPQYGRFREFTQCDFDVIGIDSVAADAEVLQVLERGFAALGLNNILIRVNNRKILNALAADLGVAEKADALIRTIDKIDKLPPQKFDELLGSEAGLNAEQIAKLKKIIIDLNQRSNSEKLTELQKLAQEESVYAQGVKEITEVFAIINALPELSAKVKLDLTIARGLAYYTGTVFETNLLDIKEIGSVASGGRYDNLTKNFEKEGASGVGGSFGLSRILAALEKLGSQDEKSPADVLLTLFDFDVADYVYSTAAELRALGVNCEVYPDTAKLKKQLQYADRRGFNYAIILGSEEKSKQVYLLKILKDGSQHLFNSVAELVSFINNQN